MPATALQQMHESLIIKTIKNHMKLDEDKDIEDNLDFLLTVFVFAE